MRLFSAILSLLLLVAFAFVLNTYWSASLPSLGRLLDPINGWGGNAVNDNDIARALNVKGLQNPVTIWVEERQVPHIHAENDHDLYYMEGYMHAKDRLFQMDLQTRAASGRISEWIGKKALQFDREKRRKGMNYAAENSLRAMEADARTKVMLDAYRDGINYYISTLSAREWPLEYKLLGVRPEPWANVKTSLMLKYMADDLTGETYDFALTYLRDRLSHEDFKYLYPEKTPGSSPVIPIGTEFSKPTLKKPEVPKGDLFAHFKDNISTTALTMNKDESGIGSNNWAVMGKNTEKGGSILCNDPHLGLNLPSLWYEVQLQAPGLNCYGASLPGAPGIVIGFNDSVTWGVTNNYRDVKDFYEITPIDGNNYSFNGQTTTYKKRVEVIKIKGEKDYVETVNYTIHGPVMYDSTFADPAKSSKMLALCWMAHRPTNELLAVYLYNRAKNYDEFVSAIKHFECPAQNFAFADRNGNVAMWGQGQFINKWEGQGRFIMEGKDSATLWGANIPMEENPHVMNPPQGYAPVPTKQ